jgi:hypothetical protein
MEIAQARSPLTGPGEGLALLRESAKSYVGQFRLEFRCIGRTLSRLRWKWACFPGHAGFYRRPLAFPEIENGMCTLVCASLPAWDLRPQQTSHRLTSPVCCTIVAEKSQVFRRAGVARAAAAPSHSVSELLIKWRVGTQCTDLQSAPPALHLEHPGHKTKTLPRKFQRRRVLPMLTTESLKLEFQAQ